METDKAFLIADLLNKVADLSKQGAGIGGMLHAYLSNRGVDKEVIKGGADLMKKEGKEIGSRHFKWGFAAGVPATLAGSAMWKAHKAKEQAKKMSQYGLQ